MKNRTYEILYGLIMDYADQKDMTNTRNALLSIRGDLDNLDDMEGQPEEIKKRKKKVIHAMCVCQMLIDLHIPIPKEDKDVILAAALTHILPDIDRTKDLAGKMTREWHIEERVYLLIEKINQDDDLLSEEEMRGYYDMIQKDKLALLVLLADRGNLMQQLHEVPSWSAERYIFETRVYYFPMCIFAKEHYHDLLGPISILMEKMRNLMEVTEILLKRYESREAELVQEIIRLKEENATIRGMIQQMKY